MLFRSERVIQSYDKKISINTSFPIETDLITQLQGKILKCSIFPYNHSNPIPNKPYTKWFDYDKITNCLSLRTRKSGDYFYPIIDGKKKIKEFMINEKIPASKRNEILMIADGSHIIWIPGFRISERTKITNETKTILEIGIDEGEENGR